ncbi:uncharacterized protein LOC144763529 [Lissotriton helveticus]
MEGRRVSSSGSAAAETAPAANADITSCLSLCVQPATEEEGALSVCAATFIYRPPFRHQICPPQTPDLPPPPDPPGGGESLDTSAQVSAQVFWDGPGGAAASVRGINKITTRCCSVWVLSEECDKFRATRSLRQQKEKEMSQFRKHF